MLISELARCTGLTIDTIRFYEKQGLLDEEHYERTANGYRHYSETAIQRLNLIKLGRAAGFTLNEMREAIRAWETNQLSAADKEFYLYRKLAEIEAKLDALNTIKTYIGSKIDQMRLAEASENMLETL
ncbi:MAG: MerR family transcriptional regulator [Anaerolineae bacterium]|nr:MerR family transcriptional regulator [Anaerolineae bacterium]